MYKTYEFTFAGEPASMFGMFMADIGNKSHADNPFGNVANIVETRLPNRVTPLHFGVLLPQGLKQLPSDSEAAERKNLKTEKLIFDNFFGQMSEANEYPFPSKGRFSKTQCFQCFEGCQNQILSPQKR